MTGTRERPSAPYAWLLPLMTAGLVLGVVLARQASCWHGAATALALSLLAAALTHGKGRIVALVLVSAALGALCTIHANHPALPAEGEYVVTGVVMDGIPGDTEQIRTRLSEVTLNGEPCASDAWWTCYLHDGVLPPEWLVPGTRVSFAGETYHPGGASNPGGYNFREALLMDGVTFGVYGMAELRPLDEPAGFSGQLAALRHRLTMALMQVMGEESGALAATMLLGSRDYLAEEDAAAFADLGIAHILSVSGYHVGILAMILSWLLARLHAPRPLKAALLGVLLALYALLTGAAPPVIRASTLVMLQEAGHLQKRQNTPLHLLCLSAALQLLLNPLQLFGASFQLTYGAMLGLILLQPRLESALYPFRFQRSRSQRGARWLWRGFTASVAVQLGLLPAQLYWFCGFPLISLVLNMFALALTTVVMLLYWLTLALLPLPGVREAFGALTGLVTGKMLDVVRFLADVVGGNVATPAANLLTVLGWALLMVGLGTLIRRDKIRLRRVLSLAGACLIAVSLVRLPHRETTWIQFSDGEADGALLHDQDAVVLVDAGEYAYTVAGYLRRHALPVDMLILTHLHIDHAGGIAGLLDWRIPVRMCCLPEDAYLAGDVDEEVLVLLEGLAATGTEFVFLSRGDALDLPSGQITALWPQAGAVRTGQSANDTGLVLLADICGTRMLLAGDISNRYEMYAALPADILKVAHHGSPDATSDAFLDAVDPQVTLLSCGTEKREAAFLARAGDIPVYSTCTSGAITIHFTQDAFTIETYLPR